MLPFQRVLKVHILWTFLDSLGHRRLDETKKGQPEAVETEWGSVDTHDAGLGSEVIFDTRSVKWPAGTKEISLVSFNHHPDALTWPVGLERLWFGRPLMAHSAFFSVPDIFNMPLDGATFPRGLREIFLGDSFNQPIEGVVWPGGMERLSLPGFNQSIRDVQWSPGLKALEFVSPSTIKLMTYGIRDRACDEHADGHVCLGDYHAVQRIGRFNQPLDETLPLSLNIVWLSNDFDQPVDFVAWPSGIVTLGLPFDPRVYPFSGSIKWPSNLEHLFTVRRPFGGMRYPRDSEVTISQLGPWDGDTIISYPPGVDPNDTTYGNAVENNVDEIDDYDYKDDFEYEDETDCGW